MRSRTTTLIQGAIVGVLLGLGISQLINALTREGNATLVVSAIVVIGCALIAGSVLVRRWRLSRDEQSRSGRTRPPRADRHPSR